MAKTRKTILPKNLATYEVLIEETQRSSTYFQVTNLPQVFTGGRNSFLLGATPLLVPGSDIQIEILDAAGFTIYQNPVRRYIEGTSRLITVEINADTTPGFATIILLGRATVTPDGRPVPPDWQNSYNVRWVTRVLVEPNKRNVSPLILLNQPQVSAEERRLFNVGTSSYAQYQVPFTASLSPILYASSPIGYLLKAEAPTTFSADYLNGFITGTISVNDATSNVYLPINEILNSTTAFSTGRLITLPPRNIIQKILLQSGSYQTPLLGSIANVTSSALLNYGKVESQNVNIPISYAQLRVTNLNTVSGELYKLRVYSKATTNTTDYSLVTDIPLTTQELLVSESVQGNVPIGNFIQSTNVGDNWYADTLEVNSNAKYPISGSLSYYSPTSGTFPININDSVLLRSINTDVPLSGSVFSSSLATTGYFVGTKNSVELFPTSEYTLKLNAIYRKTSGSVKLEGNVPQVDIYIVGVSGSRVIDQNPLGQKIGTLSVVSTAETQRYESSEFNFTPNMSVSGSVGIRFVISNGFWYFSDISLKPASDTLFSPDEVTVLVPNSTYYNEFLQHKVEFVDINNNSTDIFAESLPTFFTGSNIDMGVLP